MNKIIKKIIERIIVLAVEDYSGLWEVIWEINSSFPELSKNDKLSKAKKAIKILKDAGWVAFYYCSEPYGELTPIQARKIDQIIENDLSWEPIHQVEGVRSIRITTTDKGERAYQGGNFGDALNLLTSL